MSRYSDSIYSADERGDTFGDSRDPASLPARDGPSNSAPLIDASDSTNGAATPRANHHRSNAKASVAYHPDSAHLSNSSQQSQLYSTHQPYGSQRSYSGQQSYASAQSYRSHYTDAGVQGARQSDSAYQSDSAITATPYSTSAPTANPLTPGPVSAPVASQSPVPVPALSNPFGTYENPFDTSEAPGPGLGELSEIRDAAEQVVASIKADKTSGRIMSKLKQKLFFQCPEFFGLIEDVVGKGEKTALAARLDGSHFENIERFRLDAAFKFTLEALLEMMTAVEVMIGKQILASHLRKVMLLRLGKMHWVMERLSRGLEPLLGGRNWRYDSILKKVKACREVLRVQNGGE
ncbi:hypothetical protein B2J93_3783 [Marssonina coronariae]|uniref:Uncharacterized protein n=1 Tax=Diplocarpon coronariae TaxID=2795749 RepID=A0A218YWS6_9HELO|nr:hypothetical protein B2J93_3783 [Marssonina coronariae]